MPITTSTVGAAASLPQRSPIRTRRALQWSAVAVAIASAGGFGFATQLRHHGYTLPDRNSLDIFFRLYALHERPFFALLGICAVLVAAYAWSGTAGDEPSSPAPWKPRVSPTAALLTLAVAVCVVSWVGSHVILRDLPFAMDEYDSVYQGKIFATGRVTAPVSPEWQPFAPAMTPVLVSYYPKQHTWRAGFLPVYSAMRAPFSLAGAENLVNPVLGALALVMLALVGRRLWPARPERTWLAVLFMATSSQFLFMSMSWYAMPADLLLNLVWLWLYLRDDLLSLTLLPVVGVLALGVHNPFPHALFVAPFLIRMLWRRRFAWLGYAAVVYGAGSLVWYSWLRASDAYQKGNGLHSGSGLAGTFALPGVWQVKFQALQLSLVLSWQAPLVAIVFLVALLHWRRLGDTERDVAGGFLLTAAFYILFPLTQGHGWGYRYIYGALGNLILLAALGASLVAERVGRRRVGRMVAASTFVALLIQWPLRAVQAERFVRPFARAVEYEATRPESVVVVYPDSSYYGRDLVRNDPLLRNSPKILSAKVLGDSGVKRLLIRFGGNVHQLRPAELARLGVPTF